MKCAPALEPGAQKIAVAYLNNYNDQTNPDPKLRGDRNVFVARWRSPAPPGRPRCRKATSG